MERLKKYRSALIVAVLLTALLAGGLWVRARAQANQSGQYQTARIERGNLTATVGATGTVRAHQTALLAWQTTGTVGRVQAAAGQRVQAGEVLAALLPDSLPQSVILAQADLVQAQRALDALLESETAGSQAQLTLVNAQRAYDDARQRRERLDYQRAGQALIDDAEAKYILAQQRVDQAEQAFASVAHLPASDPARASAYTALYAARQDRDRLLAQWNWYQGQPSDLDMAEADARLALAEAQLEDARREWERLKDGPDPQDVAAARARVTAVQATLNLSRLTAPFAGTVTEAYPRPGDMVTAGTTAFRLDNLERLLVDVQVSEVDINNIRPGQPVTLTFDAILGREYHGLVVEVAQVGSVLQGVVSFKVTVELSDADEQVKPGMTAAVNIVVMELEDVVLVPNRAVRLVDGQRVVYLQRDGQVEMVEIRLGATSDMVSVVLSDNLKVGDLVILNPPAEFQMGGRPPFMRR
jgi:HlyD family secretion protein